MPSERAETPSVETPEVFILTAILAVASLLAVTASLYADIEWAIPTLVAGTIGLQAAIYNRYGRPRR
jgi:uncharacterized membrane protein